jgi:hypothetical protein
MYAPQYDCAETKFIEEKNRCILDFGPIGGSGEGETGIGIMEYWKVGIALEPSGLPIIPVFQRSSIPSSILSSQAYPPSRPSVPTQRRN